MAASSFNKIVKIRFYLCGALFIENSYHFC